MAKILGFEIPDGPTGSILLTMKMSIEQDIRVVDLNRAITKHLKSLGGEFVLQCSVTSEGIRYSWHPVESTEDGLAVDISPESTPSVEDASVFSKTAARKGEDVYEYLDRRYNELSAEENGDD